MLHDMENGNERGMYSLKGYLEKVSLVRKKELWTSGEGFLSAKAKHKAKARALGHTMPANSRHSKQANILRNHKRRRYNKREIKLLKDSRINRQKLETLRMDARRNKWNFKPK